MDRPSFLKRAKPVQNITSEIEQPSFLKRAKPVSQSKQEFISDEDVERNTERNIAQFTSRMGEAVLGLPGDLVNFVGGLFGKEPNAPGSQALREKSEELTGGYTEAEGEFEEKTGEALQDVALFALPGAKYYSVARNIGIPVAANLAKEGIARYGGDDTQQAAGKIGSMVILDLLSHRKGLGNAREYASGLFQKADELIPKGLSIDASSLTRSLDKLEKSLSMGGSRPTTGDALTKINEIRGMVKSNGKIDLKDLVAFRPSINETIDKYKGFEVSLPDKLRRKVIGNLNDVKGEVIKSAEEYGKNYNPEYLKMSQSANEAYGAYAASNKIANFVEKHAASKIKSYGLKALLGLGATGAIGGGSALVGLGLGGAAGLGAGAGYKALKTILRSKSPTLRKHYFNILSGATKGNASEVLKNSQALDKHFQEMEKTGELSLE